jgi:hypothetical protein
VNTDIGRVCVVVHIIPQLSSVFSAFSAFPEQSHPVPDKYIVRSAELVGSGKVLPRSHHGLEANDWQERNGIPYRAVSWQRLGT